jgi:hypothetical protein
MASYYKLIIPGVQTQHYAFFDGGESTAITEDTTYTQFKNTRTEAQVQAAGATSITATEYNSYVDNVESFMRIGNHPPTKP